MPWLIGLARIMLRFLGIILLSVCVIAMPSYAAVTCGTTCDDQRAAHEHECCPAQGVAAHADDAGAPVDGPKHSEDGRHHHCTAPCCGYVAHVLSTGASRVDEKPLAELLPTAAASHGCVEHDAIFHPPRL